MDKKNQPQRKAMIIFLGLLSFLIISACTLTSLLSEPPTQGEPPALAPTAQITSPMQSESPALPSVRITSPDQKEIIVAGEQVTLAFEATGTEIPFVELTLNSINGQSIASYGSPDGPGRPSPVQKTLVWTPEKAGEYSLYLTAYDTQKRASTPATVNITVLPKPESVISGSVTLQNNQSYDFVTQNLKYFDDMGDVDIAVWKYPEGWSGTEPSLDQVGGVFLYSIENENYKNVTSRLYEKKVVQNIISNATWNFYDSMVPMEKGGLYLFKRHQSPGELVLLQVTDANDDSITIEYVVFNMPQ